MKKQYTPFKHNKFTRSFSTTNNYFVDNNNRSFNRSKEFFDNNKNIKPVNNSPVDKDLSDNELFSLLEDNKQGITDNIYSAQKSAIQADKVCRKANNTYSSYRGIISAQERDAIDVNLATNNSSVERALLNSSDEDKCLFNIERKQKRLIDAMFKVKSLDDALSATGDSRATHTKNAVVNESKQLMQVFSSLAENINNGVSNNNYIREELQSRNVSLYPEEYSNAMDDA